MSRLLQLWVLAWCLCWAGGCGREIESATVRQEVVGRVELLRKGMEKSCDLSVRNGWVSWTEDDALLGSLFRCQSRTMNLPLYRMNADFANGGADYVAKGVRSAVNEVGHIGHLQKDEAYACTRAFIEGVEVGDNCRNNGTANMFSASTSFSGDSFFFTLTDDVPSPWGGSFLCANLYQYDGELRNYPYLAVTSVRVSGDLVGYVPHECITGQASRGRIADRFNPQWPLAEFGVDGHFTGHFDFTKYWVAFIDNAVFPGLDFGPVYVMNLATGVMSDRGIAGYQVVLRQDNTLMAYEDMAGTPYMRISSGGVFGSILNSREPIFDGQWLYYIGPYDDYGTEALYRTYIP